MFQRLKKIRVSTQKEPVVHESHKKILADITVMCHEIEQAHQGTLPIRDAADLLNELYTKIHLDKKSVQL